MTSRRGTRDINHYGFERENAENNDQYSVNHQAGIIEAKAKNGIPAGIYLIRVLRPSQKDIVGKL